MLSETLSLCSNVGRLRTVEGVRSDVTVILNLMEEIHDEKLPKLLKPIRTHMDDILLTVRPFLEVNPRLR
jgi:hypothetical protein